MDNVPHVQASGSPEKKSKMRITVTKGKDKTFNLKMYPENTMYDLKMKLEALTDVAVTDQFLTCLRRQKLLDAENKFSLNDFGIEDGDSFYLSTP